MSTEKTPIQLSRTAYQNATKALRERYPSEFAALLDMAYLDLGRFSPREERRRREAAEAEKRAEREAKAEARRIERIAKLKAELESLEDSNA
jgi:hypothetical protein